MYEITNELILNELKNVLVESKPFLNEYTAFDLKQYNFSCGTQTHEEDDFCTKAIVEMLEVVCGELDIYPYSFDVEELGRLIEWYENKVEQI